MSSNSDNKSQQLVRVLREKPVPINPSDHYSTRDTLQLLVRELEHPTGLVSGQIGCAECETSSCRNRHGVTALGLELILQARSNLHVIKKCSDLLLRHGVNVKGY